MVIDFSPFYDFHRNLDRLLGEAWSPSIARRATPSYPLLNVSEDDDAVYVRAEVPGMDMNDLEITLVDSSLSIKGERTPEQGKYYRQERPSGVFQRLVSINTPVDRDAVAATLKDGVLTITLPKAEETKPRKISIN
jgi:HSP20 family protein